MLKVKCGREEFELTGKDIIFDNGACYQITTQTVYRGWNQYSPIIAKATAKKLIKNGDIVLVKEEMKYLTAAGKEMWYRYYKITE